MSAGRPRSRFYQIAHRIAEGLEPRVARAFMRAVRRMERQVDMAALRAAIRAGDMPAIELITGIGSTSAFLSNDDRLQDAFLRGITATGTAGSDLLADVRGVDFRFNAMYPDVVLFAREQSSNLVARISTEQRAAIREIIAMGAQLGATVDQQARALRSVVGLMPQHAATPMRLAFDIREGRISQATARRLSAVDKAKIRSRIKRGTVSEAFVEEMQDKYEQSLINYRARTIARTETIRSANAGQRIGWKQATEEGVLPATARRVVVVTPDDRLRASHAAVPGMNPGGVGIDELFNTPWGPLREPPWKPNCRCSTGLRFPGLRGTL